MKNSNLNFNKIIIRLIFNFYFYLIYHHDIYLKYEYNSN
jgi:hypothetical protein